VSAPNSWWTVRLPLAVILAAVTCLLGAQGAAAKAAAGPGPVVRSPDGAVRGLVQDGHRLFQGIPYASPPQRWKAPQPVTPAKDVGDATKPGKECVQAAVFWRPGSPASWNEDCLYLNVWTPTRTDRKRPVLVWFHGGGWVNGAGTDVQPARLTQWGDNVVVTINYRLGAMGYLALPGLDAETADGKSSGNYGDLDKIQALKWVKRNIAAFGGDPTKVTIAGQSAGAGSTCWLGASPSAAGLFARAIVQSIGACGVVDHATEVQRSTTFAAAAGCADPAAMVACLRAKTPAEIIDAQAVAGVQLRPNSGTADEPQAPVDAFASGKFNRVPFIVGNVAHENRAFVYEANDLVKQPLTAQAYEANIRKAFGANADRVLAEYPAKDYVAPGDAQAAVDTDRGFACGTVTVADALSKWVPTYTYEFRDEQSPLRPYMEIPSSFPLGASHTADVPYVWQSETTEPLNAEQLKLSRVMIGAWSAFAASGRPAGRGLPSWPEYKADARQRLGWLTGGKTETITGAAYAAAHHCAFWASLG
jgi:para-nitrobenzyl esterase